MNIGAWILIVATHVSSGGVVSMQEFYDRPACEHAAAVARKVAGDADFVADPHTWCVPKSSQEAK